MTQRHCSCPGCGTILRIRDRTFVGREIACPECRVELVIRLSSDGQFRTELPRHEDAICKESSLEKSGRRINRDSLRKPHSQTVSNKKRANFGSGRNGVEAAGVDNDFDSPATSVSDRLRSILHSPLLLMWALAFALTAFIVVIMMRPNVTFRSSRQNESPTTSDIVSRNQTHSSDPQDDKPPLTPTENVLASVTGTETAASTSPTDAMWPANVEEGIESLPPATSSASALIAAQVGESVTQQQPLAPKPPHQPKPFDFEAALGQRFIAFEQTTKPASRRALLEQLEELLGAPIDYDSNELGEQGLNKQITFKLENTTLRGVLKAVLAPAGWEFVTDETSLRIRTKRTTSN